MKWDIAKNYSQFSLTNMSDVPTSLKKIKSVRATHIVAAIWWFQNTIFQQVVVDATVLKLSADISEFV